VDFQSEVEMAVRRIVPNIAADRIEEARRFYGNLLGLDLVMDLDWIVTFAGDGMVRPQISIATHGGSGTDVPDISIEVDDVDDIFERAKALGFEIPYGIADEPWGVRRFYVRDPFGRTLNILSHPPEARR